MGEHMGKQLMCDALQIVLNDADVMGKDVFGEERIWKVLKACEGVLDEMKPCFDAADPEAPWHRERIDRAISRNFKNRTLIPFEQRYPYLKKLK